MKELFYLIDYWEADNNIPDVIIIRIPEENAPELIGTLTNVLRPGCSEDEDDDRDRYEYVSDMLDKYVTEAGGLWSYVPMNGTFYVD